MRWWCSYADEATLTLTGLVASVDGKRLLKILLLVLLTRQNI